MAVEVDRFGTPACDTWIGGEHNEHGRAAILCSQDGLVRGPCVAFVRVASKLDLEDHHRGGAWCAVRDDLDDQVCPVLGRLQLAVGLVPSTQPELLGKGMPGGPLGDHTGQTLSVADHGHEHLV